MTEYNDVVAQAYALPSVGGSAACRANIAEGHAAIGAMFKTAAGRGQLAQLFNLPGGDWLNSTDRQRDFAGNGVAGFPAQSNDPTCTYPVCNIAKICEVMLANASKTNVERLADVRAAAASASAVASASAAAAARARTSSQMVEVAARGESPHAMLD